MSESAVYRVFTVCTALLVLSGCDGYSKDIRKLSAPFSRPGPMISDRTPIRGH
jgi:hypothetical protein